MEKKRVILVFYGIVKKKGKQRRQYK